MGAGFWVLGAGQLPRPDCQELQHRNLTPKPSLITLTRSSGFGPQILTPRRARRILVARKMAAAYYIFRSRPGDDKQAILIRCANAPPFLRTRAVSEESRRRPLR